MAAGAARVVAPREVVVRRRVVFASLAIVAVLLTGSLSAHHSPSAVFDMAKPFVIQGTLTKVDWVNPHISLLHRRARRRRLV